MCLSLIFQAVEYIIYSLQPFWFSDILGVGQTVIKKLYENQNKENITFLSKKYKVYSSCQK